jgi:hypothetical protein
MEALRADERVRFSRLPRIEAGLQPAETKESNQETLMRDFIFHPLSFVLFVSFVVK